MRLNRSETEDTLSPLQSHEIHTFRSSTHLRHHFRPPLLCDTALLSPDSTMQAQMGSETMLVVRRRVTNDARRITGCFLADGATSAAFFHFWLEQGNRL